VQRLAPGSGAQAGYLPPWAASEAQPPWCATSVALTALLTSSSSLSLPPHVSEVAPVPPRHRFSSSAEL
jgi:hypothetical protein